MKKLLILLEASILVLTVLIAGAVSIEKESLHTQEGAIEIDVEGRLLGYTVIVKNVGEEPITGNLTMNITTDAGIILLGRELSETPDVIEALPPDESVEFTMGPVLGFGFADITITGLFIPIDDPYPFDMEATDGFLLLIFVRCGLTPITIPPQ